MVDRYLLPIPKTKNMRTYMRLRNKPLWSLPYIIGILTLAFQINRYTSIRAVLLIILNIFRLPPNQLDTI